MGAAPPRPRPDRQCDRGPEGRRASSAGGCAPHAPIAEEHAQGASVDAGIPRRAALAHPPALGVSICGGCAPRPWRVGSATAGPRAGARPLRGAAPPTPPSRRSTRRVLLLTRGYPAGRLWPTRPPSEFLSVGVLPPRPRRVGSATRAPRPSARLLWGAAPPCRHRGGARAARGSPHPPALGVSICGGCAPTPPAGRQCDRGPEGRRASSAGGCAPHAPAGSAAQPRPQGRRVSVVGGAPPTPPSRTSTRCARLGPAHPPGGFFNVGAAPPRPRWGLAARTSPRGRARILRGAQPPTPRSRMSTRCARLCPRPRRIGSGTADPRAHLVPGTATALRGYAAHRAAVRAQATREAAGGVGGCAPHMEEQSGAGGWARAALRGIPASTEAPCACSSESLAGSTLRGASELSRGSWVRRRRAGRGLRRRRGSRCRGRPPRARASRRRPRRRRGRSRAGAAGRAARRGGAPFRR